MLKYQDELLERASRKRNDSGIVLIAVSGNETLRKCLHDLFSCFGMCTSGDNPIEVLAELRGDEDYAVIDIGNTKSSADEAFLSWMFSPDFAVVEKGHEGVVDGMNGSGYLFCSGEREFITEVTQTARENELAGVFSLGNLVVSSARINEAFYDGEFFHLIGEVFEEKISLLLPCDKADEKLGNAVMLALLMISVSGKRLKDAVKAISVNFQSMSVNEKATDERFDVHKDAKEEYLSDNIIKFRKNGESMETDERAFRVLAMIEHGENRNKTAFLGGINGANLPGSDKMPNRLDDMNIVYTGMSPLTAERNSRAKNDSSKNKAGQVSAKNTKDEAKSKKGVLGRIVHEVLSPGDIIKVKKTVSRKALDGQVIKDESGAKAETIIEALRAIPSIVTRNKQDPEYAV